MNAEIILETKGITKTFPGVLANDHIDFTLRKGEIHALLGENGAGKTTLMNIIYGLYTPDEGKIYLNGREVQIPNPSHAINMRIGMVHQHFMLIPNLTVTENVILGNESIKNKIFIDKKNAARNILKIAKEYKIDVDPDACIKDLPVGVQQRVEIVKALYRNANILILDEPTAVLTPIEIDGLFNVIKSLAMQGKSVIFITHKLKEVFAFANMITILRNGKVVGNLLPEEANEKKLAEMMVGHEVSLSLKKDKAKTKEKVLIVENLRVLSDRKIIAVDGINLDVKAGEILGIAGVEGNGQVELVEAITGLRKTMEGKIIINGRDTTNASPREVNKTMTSHVTEDRHKYGLVLEYPVCDNLVLSTYYRKPFSRGIAISRKEIEANADRLIRNYDIRTPSSYTITRNLSGGNQQKVIMARELSREINLLIASQPTRGLDVGSTEYIHNRILEARDKGCGVLLVSAELDEIMSLSDRVAVMYKGKIMDIIPAEEAAREKIGLLMAGIK